MYKKKQKTIVALTLLFLIKRYSNKVFCLSLLIIYYKYIYPTDEQKLLEFKYLTIFSKQNTTPVGKCTLCFFAFTSNLNFFIFMGCYEKYTWGMGGRAERRVKHAQTHEQGTPLAISEFFSSYDNYVFPPLHLNTFTETYKSNKIIMNQSELLAIW